jgi:hypothetical protein
MITLEENRLVFRFPEVHPDAECRIEFQRTLRIPDDNRAHDLPAGLGTFPLRHVEDHAARLPSEWARHGGVLLPMYQAEAMWISFGSRYGSYPFAVKVAAGKVNAVSGESWREGFNLEAEQDYVVLPEQSWLDGFCVNEGLIRQFVAMPLGQGYTAEEQVTGEAVHGGLQLVVYPMKRARYDEIMAAPQRAVMMESVSYCASYEEVHSASMGLAPGGLMQQQIFSDEFGPDAWETGISSRCFVHILNSESWRAATGSPPPTEPITAADYAEAGIPWFHYYDESATAVPGSTALAGMDSVGAKTLKKGGAPLDPDAPPPATPLVNLGPSLKGTVKDGKW